MAPDARERGTGLLYVLTIWIGGISAGLVGVFAGIAAATIPGVSDASASTSAAPPADTTPVDAATPDPFQVQAPVAAPVAVPPEQPHARSGASSHR